MDTTVVPKCEEQESRYHHSRIVGHDSRVVDEYHADNYGHDGYHKRSAYAGEYGYYSGTKGEDKKEQECHKHPHENSRKIPKTTCEKIVDIIFIEECEEIIHTVCEEAHEQHHQSEHVAGHETEVVGGSVASHEEHHGNSYIQGGH